MRFTYTDKTDPEHSLAITSNDTRHSQQQIKPAEQKQNLSRYKPCRSCPYRGVEGGWLTTQGKLQGLSVN